MACPKRRVIVAFFFWVERGIVALFSFFFWSKVALFSDFSPGLAFSGLEEQKPVPT